MTILLKIATLIDPRFKNHSNIFIIAEQIENKALLEAELLTQKNSDHPALIRNLSDYLIRRLEKIFRMMMIHLEIF